MGQSQGRRGDAGMDFEAAVVQREDRHIRRFGVEHNHLVIGGDWDDAFDLSTFHGGGAQFIFGGLHGRRLSESAGGGLVEREQIQSGGADVMDESSDV